MDYEPVGFGNLDWADKGIWVIHGYQGAVGPHGNPMQATCRDRYQHPG